MRGFNVACMVPADSAAVAFTPYTVTESTVTTVDLVESKNAQ